MSRQPLVGVLVGCVLAMGGCARREDLPSPGPPGHGQARCALLEDALRRGDEVAVRRLHASKNECVAMSRALNNSIFDDDLDGVRLALEGGADPNAGYGDLCHPPLFLAFASRHRDSGDWPTTRSQRAIVAATLLLKSGADPNGPWQISCIDFERLPPFHRGMTPLMVAAAFGDAPFVRVLLLGGADVRAVDAANQRAIDYARQSPRQGSTEVVALLGQSTALSR